MPNRVLTGCWCCVMMMAIGCSLDAAKNKVKHINKWHVGRWLLKKTGLVSRVSFHRLNYNPTALFGFIHSILLHNEPCVSTTIGKLVGFSLLAKECSTICCWFIRKHSGTFISRCVQENSNVLYYNHFAVDGWLGLLRAFSVQFL